MLTRYQNAVPVQFFVKRMLDGIQASNTLTIDIAKAHVLDNILVDWMGYISYMLAKVAIEFHPRSGGGIKRKGDRKISKFDSKRICGGGRGRGHGQGCGGRGGHHSVSNRHNPANGWFHGVDCSEFRRSLSRE